MPRIDDPTVDLDNDLNILLTEDTSSLPELAVNVCDLTRIDEIIRDCLGLRDASVGGKMDIAGGWIVVDSDRADEGCVRFTCDLLTAACVMDNLRTADKNKGRYPTRCAVKHRNRNAWDKVPGNVTLTVINNEQRSGTTVKLNPEVFRIKAKPVEVAKPERFNRPMKFKR